MSPEARPGHYTFQVLPVARAEKEPPPYQVWVFENDKALKATYKSFVRRIFGFGPIWMVFMTLPLVAASLGGSYYLSSRQEDHLAENGIVPIIRMARCKHGWEVDFALGSRDGLSARDELLVLNSHFEKAGRITVDQVARNPQPGPGARGQQYPTLLLAAAGTQIKEIPNPTIEMRNKI